MSLIRPKYKEDRASGVQKGELIDFAVLPPARLPGPSIFYILPYLLDIPFGDGVEEDVVSSKRNGGLTPLDGSCTSTHINTWALTKPVPFLCVRRIRIYRIFMLPAAMCSDGP